MAPQYTNCNMDTFCKQGNYSIFFLITMLFDDYESLICEKNATKRTFDHYVATLALGLRPRQTGLQGCGLKGRPKVTPHASGNVGKCEGMNPHTPKATPTLGDGVSVDSQIFKG